MIINIILISFFWAFLNISQESFSLSKAESKRDGLEYAVKKVELPQNPKYRKQILREKQSLQGLNHENVIKSYHFTITKEKFHGKILFSE